ncbi:MAG: hypothetical protein AUJ98_08045 [Bacteroidetes bacterium CG2_30_33_31]|nr:MAG: hypothetical protein AUJ98_08045 [Bacteroidetes bacterium CG2_30_33_31]
MNKTELFEYQNLLFRNPQDIAGVDIHNNSVLSKSLKYNCDDGFMKLLNSLNITLLISREYEHLLLGISSDGENLKQTYYPLAHPSGIAVDNNNNTIYVASTRNPNKIVEFKVVSEYSQRIEDKAHDLTTNIFMPSREKYFPGSYYFHDLAFIGAKLFGNSVGQNAVIEIDMNSFLTDEIIWQPNVCTTDARKITEGNYLQLNSIAAGTSLQNSYFSASTFIVGKSRPGQKNFKVDNKGVIFSGDGNIFASGLTRPHSARIHKDKIWINNSGYGSFGYIKNGKYISFATLPGWTRGMHFVNNVVFIGVSRVLPRFENYAPGLKDINSISAIFAFDTIKGNILGKIEFPFGNQIFSIESINKNISQGFVYQDLKNKTKKIKSHFYKYKFK